MKRIVLIPLFFLPIFTVSTYALTLEEGLKIATEHGRDVQISQMKESQAESDVAIAKSPMLPINSVIFSLVIK